VAVRAADGWSEAAKPGAVVLFRHATAPGVGDPAGFKLDDCATQRNLSEQGRAEARRAGRAVPREEDPGRRGAHLAVVPHARDRAAGVRRQVPRDEPLFNSFFSQSTAQREAQTARARDLIARWKGPGTLVVVTHQVNITALTGIGAASAEGVVLRPVAAARLKVVGTIEP
jgi:broad specificity phosphatase PhoE